MMSGISNTMVQLRSGHAVALPPALYRVAAAVALCAVLASISDAFLTQNNLLNVLRQASLLFLLASGLTLVILTGGLDLSVGANVGLSACVAGLVIHSTGSVAWGMTSGVACGLLVGMANAVLVTVLRLPPFIATYGMLWALHGITYALMAGATIHGFPPAFRALGSGYALGIPIPVHLMLGLLAIGSFFALRTTQGQEIYAIGANSEVARLSGVPVQRRLFFVYSASGAMAGLAALVYLARLNAAEGDIGEGLTLPAIAAVLIGGASLFGGSGTLVGTLAGALILTLVLNGMNLMTVHANWQPVVTGAVLVLAVYIDFLARRKGGAGAR